MSRSSGWIEWAEWGTTPHNFSLSHPGACGFGGPYGETVATGAYRAFRVATAGHCGAFSGADSGRTGKPQGGNDALPSPVHYAHPSPSVLQYLSSGAVLTLPSGLLLKLPSHTWTSNLSSLLVLSCTCIENSEAGRLPGIKTSMGAGKTFTGLELTLTYGFLKHSWV